MRRLRLNQLLATLAVSGIVIFAAPASSWADSTININPGNLNTTALEFADKVDPYKDCSANQGGGPYADQDVWVFNLPGNENTVGVFLSITATWDTPGGLVTKTITADGGVISPAPGTSKAWITLDAGWELKAASAVISGTAPQFVLTHVCPAKDDGSTPTPTPTETDPTDPGTPPTDPGTPGLPTTGAAVLSMTVIGGVAVVAGAALIWLMRRRRDALTNLED